MKRERGGVCSDMSDSLQSYGLEPARLRKILNILSEPPRLHEHAEISLQDTFGSLGPQMKKLSAEVQNYLDKLRREKKNHVLELWKSFRQLS